MPLPPIPATTMNNIWVRSSYCDTGGCAELLRDGHIIFLRNSTVPDAGLLVFTVPEIAAFINGVKDGEFDHLVEPTPPDYNPLQEGE